MISLRFCAAMLKAMFLPRDVHVAPAAQLSAGPVKRGWCSAAQPSWREQPGCPEPKYELDIIQLYWRRRWVGRRGGEHGVTTFRLFVQITIANMVAQQMVDNNKSTNKRHH